MGYYTKHSLTVINGDEYNIDYEQEIADITDGYDKHWLWGEESKWYDCDQDMLKYSLRYPNTTFLIDGEGESGDDIWKAWFKNGKMFKTQGQLVFEEYNENKLT